MTNTQHSAPNKINVKELCVYLVLLVGEKSVFGLIQNREESQLYRASMTTPCRTHELKVRTLTNEKGKNLYINAVEMFMPEKGMYSFTISTVDPVSDTSKLSVAYRSSCIMKEKGSFTLDVGKFGRPVLANHAVLRVSQRMNNEWHSHYVAL